MTNRLPSKSLPLGAHSWPRLYCPWPFACRRQNRKDTPKPEFWKVMLQKYLKSSRKSKQKTKDSGVTDNIFQQFYCTLYANNSSRGHFRRRRGLYARKRTIHIVRINGHFSRGWVTYRLLTARSLKLNPWSIATKLRLLKGYWENSQRNALMHWAWRVL